MAATPLRVRLSRAERTAAVRAAAALGLEVAGVDMLVSERGPLVTAVNASPELESIERATGVDVAGKIYEYLERQAAGPEKKPVSVAAAPVDAPAPVDALALAIVPATVGAGAADLAVPALTVAAVLSEPAVLEPSTLLDRAAHATPASPLTAPAAVDGAGLDGAARTMPPTRTAATTILSAPSGVPRPAGRKLVAVAGG